MKRKIDADSQGAENQRDETRLEIERHRMPRKQIDAYEQVERSPAGARRSDPLLGLVRARVLAEDGQSQSLLQLKREREAP